MSTLVTETPASSSNVALRHFRVYACLRDGLLDVHESLKSPKPDFILVDQ